MFNMVAVFDAAAGARSPESRRNRRTQVFPRGTRSGTQGTTPSTCRNAMPELSRRVAASEPPRRHVPHERSLGDGLDADQIRGPAPNAIEADQPRSRSSRCRRDRGLSPGARCGNGGSARWFGQRFPFLRCDWSRSPLGLMPPSLAGGSRLTMSRPGRSLLRLPVLGGK